MCADVAELYETDVEGYLLAACRDADTAGLYNGYEPQKKKYTDEVMKLKARTTTSRRGCWCSTWRSSARRTPPRR